VLGSFAAISVLIVPLVLGEAGVVDENVAVEAAPRILPKEVSSRPV
jgi:hypothetical protein